jgi:alpha-beta hydrolase superfamily lysophospholipase
MRNLRSRLLRILVAAPLVAGGAVAALVGLWIARENVKGELSLWHRQAPREEFRAGRATDLEGYLAIERRVDAELPAILPGGEEGDGADVVRWRQELARRAREHFGRDWRRTVRISPAGEPVGGALLLHGLSDSPYSLHAIAEALAADGWEVLVPRLPGHGTVPAALDRIEAEDLESAARLSLAALAQQLGPDRPLLVVGYSTGAPLAVGLALEHEESPTARPRIDGIVLVSPALAVTPFAIAASAQQLLGRLPALEKVAWRSIQPEYDPFKYNSFPVGAGEVVRRLTRSVEDRVLALSRRSSGSFPPTLTFASAADSTVDVEGSVRSVLARLPGDGHELVVFDVDRSLAIRPLLSPGAGRVTDRLRSPGASRHSLTIVGNESERSRRVVARRAGDTKSTEPLGLDWPEGVFSLSHVALPFPPRDPIYGLDPAAGLASPHLGRLEARGEKDLLVVPAQQILRLRSNPFFDWMMGKIERFATERRGSGRG